MHVLIIDDDPIDRASWRRAARNLPWTISEAAQPAAAEHILADQAIDLILLDVRMGAIDGIDWLAKSDLTIPCVILTTSDDDGDRRRAWQAGAAGYFVKPIDAHEGPELLACIDTYWRKSLDQALDQISDGASNQTPDTQ